MVGVGRLVGLILAVAVLVVILGGLIALFPNLLDTAVDTLTPPDRDPTREENQAMRESQEALRAYHEFRINLREAVNGSTACFGSYTPFTEAFYESGHRVEIARRGNGMQVQLHRTAEDNSAPIGSPLTLSVKPCGITTRPALDSFVQNVEEGTPLGVDISSSHMSTIVFAEHEEVSIDGNSLNLYADELTNTKAYFLVKEDTLCFIPMENQWGFTDACNHDSKTLRDSCFDPEGSSGESIFADLAESGICNT